jgi:hypothetical protein
MDTNVNLATPIGRLALLATGFLLLTAGLTFGYSLVMKKVSADESCPGMAL